MDQNEFQKTVMEFEKNRNNLMTISNQKQQVQFQLSTIKKTNEELDKTKEKKVYKAVGNILILADVGEVKSELKEQEESSTVRLNALQKQEDSLVEKINKLKSTIETEIKAQQGNTKPEVKE